MSIPQQPAQAAPQSVAAPVVQEQPTIDERVGNIARGFLADLDANDDPDQINDESPQEAVPQEVETTAEEGQEAETPPPEIPLVEVDIDGEKYQIPEKVKHRVMADKDYRQKTMEVAAERKQLETLTATVAQLAQQAQQLAPYNAQLHVMDSRAQFLQQRLQSPELHQDPVEFSRVQGELAILLHQRGQFANGLQQAREHLEAEQVKVRAARLQMEAPKLFQKFPELQKPESVEKLSRYVREAGLPEEAIAFLNYSAAGTELAWKAHQFDVMVADQAKAKAKLAEKTKDLPAASQSSRAVDVSAKDQQQRREWQKRGSKWNDPLFKIPRNR